MSDDADYKALKALAAADPNILAFWLGGSRGMDRATEHSDYDCIMVVRDEVADAYRALYGKRGGARVECSVAPLSGFEVYAAWGGPQAWDRYSFAHATAEIDKTGGHIQSLIDAKGCVPPARVSDFIASSLDHFINQIYRAAKCRRDGDVLAAHLEAAEAISPFLAALFALNNGRLRPFAKYLRWELETYPLARCPWPAPDLLKLIRRVLDDADPGALLALLTGAQSLFTDSAHVATFEGWGRALPYMIELLEMQAQDLSVADRKKRASALKA